MASSWVHRYIKTGGLEIDGSSVEMRLAHKASVSPLEEWDEVSTSSEDGYNNRRAVSGWGMRSDLVIISKEITAALREGHEVTAETDRHGRSEFTKIGPFVLGFSERQALISVGRLGLKNTLGLNEPEAPQIHSDASDSHNIAALQ